MNKEKGSITLFVLVAMLLIISVLAIIYIQISEKNNNQLKQIETIQEEYETNDIEQEYLEAVENKK